MNESKIIEPGKAVSPFNQEELKELYDTQIDSWKVETKEEKEAYIQQLYERAKTFALEKADAENFFKNSIGFWTLKSYTPRRRPDHTSIYFTKNGNVKISSRYWYTPSGVYRRSNHWGLDIASCSWMIKDRRYPLDGVSKGYTETAFISWEELYPKGGFSRHWETGVYGYFGFEFK